MQKSFFLFFFACPTIFFNLSGSLLTAEFRIGQFAPKSEYFKNVFKSGITEFEIQSSLRIADNLTAWVNYNTVFKTGNSLSLTDEKKEKLNLISFGVKFAFELLSKIYIYTGLGANHALKHSHANSWGVVFKNGILLCANNYFFLDIFFDYYHNQMCIDNACPNVSGLRAGLGVGIGF